MFIIWFYMMDIQYIPRNIHSVFSLENYAYGSRLVVFYFFHLVLINPLSAGTELIRFIIENIMVADALAPRVARTSVPMILIM